MRRTHRTFSILGLSAALTISMSGLTSAAADHSHDPLPTSPSEVAEQPGVGSPSGVRPERAGAQRRLAPRSASARKSPWPTSKVHAVTVEDTAVDPAAAPAQQLASATLTQDVVRGTYNAKVRLRGKPSATKDSWVIVSFGKTNGDGYTCNAIGGEDSSTVYWRAYGSSVPNLIRRGAYMELKNFPSATAKRDQFDCAYAETWEILPDDAPDGEQSIIYSGRGDYSLTRTYDKPKLKIAAPKRIDVQPGAWKTVKVKIHNTNPRVAAPGVRVTVQGKKVTTRTVKLGKVRPGATKTAKVRIKVQRGFSSKAKIKVTTRNLAKTKKLRLT